MHYNKVAEQDFSHHKTTILQYIKDHESIKQFVFTGHGYAGAVAFVEHLTMQGLLEPDNFMGWKDVTIECKSLTFAAPMSLIDLNKVDVRRNACNVVYGSDICPRLFGCTDYITNAFDELQLEAEQNPAYLTQLNRMWMCQESFLHPFYTFYKDLIEAAGLPPLRYYFILPARWHGPIPFSRHWF
jgi:hypothetical protein